MLPKYIFDNRPIHKKSNEFQWVLKNVHAELPGPRKKEVVFLWLVKKKSCEFSWSLSFLVLEFRRGLAQFYGISIGKSMFSKGKVTNL